MNRRSSWFLLAWVAIATQSFLPATQNQRTPEPLARLTAKGVTGDTTAPVSVPVYLETSSDTNLKSLTFEVKYPQDALLFTTAEKGFLLESTEFALKTEPSPASSEEKLQAVRITVSSSVAEKPIPQGVIFYIKFGVAAKMAEELKKRSEAAPNSSPDSARETVAVKSSFVEARTVDGTLLPQNRLAAENEPIVLFQVVPLAACFFYMH